MTSHIPREQMITFLLTTPFFESLEPREMMEIIHVVEKIECKEGDIIFEENAPGDAWYVVYKGSVTVEKSGTEIATIGERGCFGEMSIVDKLPRSATIRAAEDSVLLCVKSADFDELIKEEHLVAYKLLHEMESQVN